MLKQKPCLTDAHKKRIDEVARGHAENVILVARNTSGKTYTLFVTVPGLRPIQKAVVRLHRKFHKIFWAIVKAAQAWLAAFKALYAPALLLLPATVGSEGVKTAAQMLATAAAAIPEKATVAAAQTRQRGHKGDNIKTWATRVANEYYHPETNIYDRGLREEIRKLNAERAGL